MRPVLALTAASLVDCAQADARRIAAALEYLHASSLILDDLPCMDDAPERRGRPSTHARFGQGVALLAAMALLNQTYSLLARCRGGAELVKLACDCIGHAGMVGGQAIDLLVDPQARADIRDEHYLKTTALFRLALLAPALSADAPAADRAVLAEYGQCAGMAYQLIDDAHDLAGDTQRESGWDGSSMHELKQRAALWAQRASDNVTRHFGDKPEGRFLSGFAHWIVEGAQSAAVEAGTC